MHNWGLTIPSVKKNKNKQTVDYRNVVQPNTKWLLKQADNLISSRKYSQKF